MSRIRTLALVVLMLSYGAVGARQPAVRTSVPLGIDASLLASGLGMSSFDRSRLLLDVVRITFASPDGQDPNERSARAKLQALYAAPDPNVRQTVPLPLDPAVWRDTILMRQVPDAALVAAILSDRSTALLYHGLAALDDETLAALGADRDTLEALRRHPGAFATFGRALRIHAGRIVVPGGADAEPLWQELVGVEPTRTGAFVRRLFSSDSGRLAYFFDALGALDAAHQRFATGRTLPEASRLERMRALLDVFEQTAPEWHPEERPFARPVFDPSITLSLVNVTSAGDLAPPFRRRMWSVVFRGDESDTETFSPVTTGDLGNDEDSVAVDAAWIVSRVHRARPAVGRRRLETILFAQRISGAGEDRDAQEADVASALRGYISFPALQMTLERIGDSSPVVLSKAASRAQGLDDVRDEAVRKSSTTLFQSTIGILGRIAVNHGLPQEDVTALVTSLLAIDTRADGYGGRFDVWFRQTLVPALRSASDDDPDPIEGRVVATMAGPAALTKLPIVSWEGRDYRVDPAYAEARRLRAIREKQGGLPLDDALALSDPAHAVEGKAARGARISADAALGGALTSLLYAAYLGDPDGMALSGDNVALRHELSPPAQPQLGWRLPAEVFGGRTGWHVSGSLLGLDAALARLSLRRLDGDTMPTESKTTATLRQTTALTAALVNTYALTDAARDEIAAALGRGRARLAALTADRADVERLAREAGLSEWRREALAWTMTQDPGRAASALSLVELFWLGAPRQTAAAPLDPWGASVQPLTGCTCLRMPRAQPWENLAGRPAQGLLATRAADVSLLVAEALASRKLPASLAPGIVGLAMQDALEQARPAYFDDWSGFTSAVIGLPADRMDDYIAALTANGPLVALPRAASTASRR